MESLINAILETINNRIAPIRFQVFLLYELKIIYLFSIGRKACLFFQNILTCKLAAVSVLVISQSQNSYRFRVLQIIIANKQIVNFLQRAPYLLTGSKQSRSMVRGFPWA